MSVKLFRSGSGRHRQRKAGTLARGAATAGVAVAAAAGVLGGAASAATPPTPVTAPQDDDEDDSPEPPQGNRSVGLIVIDNSFADSWLEIDRTLNTLLLSRGTAGSDHDGGGGAIDVHTGDGSGAGAPPKSAPAPAQEPASEPRPASSGHWIGEIGHPTWQGESGE
ncbi:hypothetical protein [Streptomyces sp. NPDC056244]|uniref:hypothetical protein n=1 Tax=Streptomyces sp. NPDC056244 TaxID=3345762 RepID=UPI0035E348F9